MKLLALDVGERHTGVAFYDPAIDFVIPLDTIHTTKQEELVAAATAVAKARDVSHIVVGLPLLLSGLEGSQARYAREVGGMLSREGFVVDYIDERFTTDRQSPADGDAKAACIVLNTYREQSASRGIDKS